MANQAYEIHVKGDLSRDWADWLENMQMCCLEKGEMILQGFLADQAALMGILNKLNGLNLTILSVCKTDCCDPEQAVQNKPSNESKQEKLGDRMNETSYQKRDFEAIAWGAFFILWGITELYPSLPVGTGAFGIGLILLGLNAARHLYGLPTSRFTITVGILALVWGGLELAGVLLSLPFEIPVFAILLVVLGVIVLTRQISANRNAMGGL